MDNKAAGNQSGSLRKSMELHALGPSWKWDDRGGDVVFFKVHQNGHALSIELYGNSTFSVNYLCYCRVNYGYDHNQAPPS